MRSGISAMKNHEEIAASFLEEKRDDRENRVEDERRDRERAIGGGRLAQEDVLV